MQQNILTFFVLRNCWNSKIILFSLNKLNYWENPCDSIEKFKKISEKGQKYGAYNGESEEQFYKFEKEKQNHFILFFESTKRQNIND